HRANRCAVARFSGVFILAVFFSAALIGDARLDSSAGAGLWHLEPSLEKGFSCSGWSVRYIFFLGHRLDPSGDTRDFLEGHAFSSRFPQHERVIRGGIAHLWRFRPGNAVENHRAD